MAETPSNAAKDRAARAGRVRAAGPSRVRAVLWVSTWSLVFAGYFALATVRTVGIPILLFPMAMLLAKPVCERLEARWRAYRILVQATTVAYLCFIPLTAMLLGLTNAVVALIMYIQLILMLHRKGEREFLLMYLMSFFLLLAACVQSPEPGIALAMLLYLLSAIWAFLTLRLYVEEEASRALSPPEILPLHAGSGAGSQSLFDRGLIGAIGGLSVMAMLLTVAVFMFVPRIEAGFFGRGHGDTAITDIDEVVDLMGDAFLEEDDTPVMYVYFPDLPADKRPSADSLYWRSATMGFYENSRWSRGTLREFLDPRLIFPDPLPGTVPTPDATQVTSPGVSTGSSFGGGFGYGPSSSGFGSSYSRVTFQNTPQEITRRRRTDTELLHYTVYMPEKPSTGVPALDLVYRLRITGGDGRTTVRWDRYQDYTLTLRGRGDRQLDYTAWSELGEPDPDALREAEGDPRTLWEEYHQAEDYKVFTYHDLFDSTQAFIAELTEDEDNLYDKAIVIQNWLSGPEFRYTLDLPQLPPSHTIDAFMMVVRAGHCELFASAMALSLRSLGIPTRVVSGYHGGEVNQSDGSYIVRRSMAHLWVEAWIPEFGWVRFDPSPLSRSVQLSRLHRLTLFLSRYRLKAQMLWYREVVGFNSGIQIERLKDFTVAFFRSFSLPGEAEEGTMPEGAPVNLPVEFFTGGALLVALAVVFRRFRRRPSRKAWRLTEDQQRSVRLYRALRRRLRRCGVPASGDTAGDLLEGLARAEHVPLDAVRGLVETYNEVRFGHRPLTRERFGELMQQIRRLRLATE